MGLLMCRLLALVPLFAAGCLPGAVPNPGPPDLGYPVGAFTLTERSGRTVTEKDLLGKVWVASFVFTRCTGGCPQVTATMARLQKELPPHPDLRFVTFTVDPERDDLKTLNEYADLHRADKERWLFLTGKRADVRALVQGGFKLSAGDEPAAGQTPEQALATHSTKLAVVDRTGVMRGRAYDGMLDPERGDRERFEAGVAELKAKVAELLK